MVTGGARSGGACRSWRWNDGYRGHRGAGKRGARMNIGCVLLISSNRTQRLPLCNNTVHGLYLPTMLRSLPNLPADYNGWLQYTAFNLSQAASFDRFLGRFSVPTAPVRAPQMLYIFTALQARAASWPMSPRSHLRLAEY
jgi:hypothetical protein